MTSFFGTLSLVIFTTAVGLGSCQAQDRPPVAAGASNYEDLRGSPTVAFQGQLWIGDREIGGVLDPAERDGITVVEGAFSTSMFGLTWHAKPVAAITNTFEIDCEAQKYRKLSETWLSASGEPLTRLEEENAQWLDGRHPMTRWACGDPSVQPVGPRFSSVSEFVGLYDAEAARRGLRPRVSGPTIVSRPD